MVKVTPNFELVVSSDISVFERLNKLVSEKKLSSIVYVFHEVIGKNHYHILIRFKRPYVRSTVESMLLHDVQPISDYESYYRYLSKDSTPTKVEFKFGQKVEKVEKFI